MESVTILAIEDVLGAAATVTKGKTFVVDNIKFVKNSMLSLILLYGTKCVECEESALYFICEDNQNIASTQSTLRLMFEHTDIDGSYAYMTRDHIIPKKHGGPNTMDNYQPMCNICNTKKGALLHVDKFPKRLADYKLVDGKYVKQSLKLFEPDVDPYKFYFYQSYIRWNTIIFHRNSPIKKWNDGVKVDIFRSLRKLVGEDFDVKTFNAAYKNLATEVKSQPLVAKKNKPVPQQKPAALFNKANQVDKKKKV